MNKGEIQHYQSVDNDIYLQLLTKKKNILFLILAFFFLIIAFSALNWKYDKKDNSGHLVSAFGLSSF